MPTPLSPWPPVVTFDFENATPAQKEVLARENAHCLKMFQTATPRHLQHERGFAHSSWHPKERVVYVEIPHYSTDVGHGAG